MSRPAAPARVRSIEDLAPHPRNARVIADPNAAALAVSLEEFGDISGITYNVGTGRLVAGHQRVAKLQDAGARLVRFRDGAYLQHPKTGERFPIRFVDWDEDRELRALATANNQNAQGAWAPDAASILAPLAQMDLAKALRLDIMLAGLPRPKGATVDDGAAPPAPERPVSKPGDLWILGTHRILCGNAVEAESVRSLLAGQEKPVLVATDAPYGVDYAGLVESRRNQKKGGWTAIEGDALDDGKLRELVRAAISVPSARTLFVWHAWARIEVFLAAVRDAGWTPRQEIVWVKNALVFGSADYQWRHETCIYAKREGADRQTDRTATTVWEIPKVTGSEHPTQKPLDCFAIPIRNHTREGEVVYDPFLGSGSSLIAADQLGRRLFGVDIDPRYVDVAVLRWQRQTGQRAVHGETGKAFGT